MFNNERQNKILETLESDGRVEVAGLSDRFGVSVDTIRRDLKRLEEEGLLKRTHGGAVRVKPRGDVHSYATRKRIYSKEKMTIASCAAGYINDHDSLLIDGSTTLSALVPLLENKKNLKVFTNNIQIASELIQVNSGIKVFIIGGLLDNQHGTAVSHDAVSFIEKLRVNKVLIGSCAISPERGLSSSEMDDTAIKKAMLKAGEEIFILADHTKFTRESLMKVAALLPEYKIVTDHHLKEVYPEIYMRLVETGCQVIIAM